MKIIIHGVDTADFVLVGRAVRYLAAREQQKDAIIVYREGANAVTLYVRRNKGSITVRLVKPA